MGETLVDDASRRSGEVQGEESDHSPLEDISMDQNRGQAGLVKDTRMTVGFKTPIIETGFINVECTSPFPQPILGARENSNLAQSDPLPPLPQKQPWGVFEGEWRCPLTKGDRLGGSP